MTRTGAFLRRVPVAFVVAVAFSVAIGAWAGTVYLGERRLAAALGIRDFDRARLPALVHGRIARGSPVSLINERLKRPSLRSRHYVAVEATGDTTSLDIYYFAYVVADPFVAIVSSGSTVREVYTDDFSPKGFVRVR